jgi:3-dehydroquinate dehydratase-2
MTRPIFILNGPNLNLLGQREPHIYGSQTLAELASACRDHASLAGASIDFRQTNQEGEFISWLHEARAQARAVILNPAAWTHYSIALHDALKALDCPVIEVHLSNPASRESFRHVSFVAPVVTGTIAGLGAKGYLLALDACFHLAPGARP